MTKQPHSPDRFLTWPEVHARVRLSRTTVWRREKDGTFPRRVRVTPGRVAWRESEIDAFVAGTWTPKDGKP